MDDELYRLPFLVDTLIEDEIDFVHTKTKPIAR
jgi:hypothetical protein